MKLSRRNIFRLSLFTLLAVSLAVLSGCHQEQKSLIVYAGKGLKKPVEEIRQLFENRYNIPVSAIYAGSDTLQTTIQKTRKGDIFIPGSAHYIDTLQNKATTSRFVAKHIPTFIVHPDGNNHLQSFADLMQEGVKIAVGNKDMCAIGKVAEKIISSSEQQEAFRRNIVITGSTVNELLNLVAQHEVDAALAWEDMIKWPEAKGMKLIPIPETMNTPKQIKIAVLASSTSPKTAAMFVDFVTTEGKKIFAEHGFRVE